MMITGLTGEIANRLSVKMNQSEHEMRKEVYEELRTAIWLRRQLVIGKYQIP